MSVANEITYVWDSDADRKGFELCACHDGVSICSMFIPDDEIFGLLAASLAQRLYWFESLAESAGIEVTTDESGATVVRIPNGMVQA